MESQLASKLLPAMTLLFLGVGVSPAFSQPVSGPKISLHVEERVGSPTCTLPASTGTIPGSAYETVGPSPLITTDIYFVVTQADCDHVGNRDVGRDRAIVTWRNHDNTEDSDHIDLRYCP